MRGWGLFSFSQLIENGFKLFARLDTSRLEFNKIRHHTRQPHPQPHSSKRTRDDDQATLMNFSTRTYGLPAACDENALSSLMMLA